MSKESEFWLQFVVPIDSNILETCKKNCVECDEHGATGAKIPALKVCLLWQFSPLAKNSVLSMKISTAGTVPLQPRFSDPAQETTRNPTTCINHLEKRTFNDIFVYFIWIMCCTFHGFYEDDDGRWNNVLFWVLHARQFDNWNMIPVIPKGSFSWIWLFHPRNCNMLFLGKLCVFNIFGDIKICSICLRHGVCSSLNSTP